jgi:hypothetical protein
LLWKSDVNLTILNSNERFIDCNISCSIYNINWYATCFYGFSTHNEKQKCCDLIRDISDSHQHDNWLIFGNFNIVLNSDEKLGGNPINTILSDTFHNTLNSCNLIDLGYIGEKFTWANNQANKSHIQERLDRFLATNTWSTNFPIHTNNHLLRYASDHCPMLLEFWPNSNCRFSRKKRCIPRFEQLWLQNNESMHIVKSAWKHSSGDITSKLKATLDQLHSWGKESFGDIPRRINQLQHDLKQLKHIVPDECSIKKIKDVERNLDDLTKEDELWWAHRAKANWLQTGDKNSKIFHIKASQRKKRNTINSIQDPRGNIWSDQEKISATFIDYFKTIFGTANPTVLQQSLDVVKDRISQDQQLFLQQDYTADEVCESIKQMKSTTAPGPDGLSALFYQAYWDTIDNDVTNYVLNILKYNGDPGNINHTYLCLIPKIKNPTLPSDFRPIALCNVIFKIVTKTIANRLKQILPNVVSP